MIKRMASNNDVQAGLHDTTISKPYQAGSFQRTDILDNKGVGIGHISYKVEGNTLKLDMIKIDAMKSMDPQGREFLKSFKNKQ